MTGNTGQGCANAGDGVLDRGLARNFEPEIASDGVHAGSIERDTATVDGFDQLTGAGVGAGRRLGLKPAGAQAGKKTLGGVLSHTLAFA